MVSRIQSPKLKRAEDSTTEKFEKNIKYLPIKIKSKKYFSEGLKYTGYYFVLQSKKMYLYGGSMMIFCNFPKKKTLLLPVTKYFAILSPFVIVFPHHK